MLSSDKNKLNKKLFLFWRKVSFQEDDFFLKVWRAEIHRILTWFNQQEVQSKVEIKEEPGLHLRKKMDK